MSSVIVNALDKTIIEIAKSCYKQDHTNHEISRGPDILGCPEVIFRPGIVTAARSFAIKTIVSSCRHYDSLRLFGSLSLSCERSFT